VAAQCASTVTRASGFLVVWLLVFAAPAPSHADVALLLGESYGRFGSVSPLGHAAVYLSRVCAESPTVLRRCVPGETGVVISRYHRVAGFDWLAIPLIPYLYAVDRADQVPSSADSAAVFALRDSYRRSHLTDLIPSAPSGEAPRGDWSQLMGSTYDRTIVAFALKTSAAQDDELIRTLNDRENSVRFNLLFRNCADFARDVINLNYPRALRSNVIADLGFTTPKQIAKSLVKYGSRRPELELKAFVIPQIPGHRRDSRDARGVLESLVKTKKYVIPLALLQPWIPTGFAAGYVLNGRFRPQAHALHTYEPIGLEEQALLAAASE
jgi:hypothetical protein